MDLEERILEICKRFRDKVVVEMLEEFNREEMDDVAAFLRSGPWTVQRYLPLYQYMEGLVEFSKYAVIYNGKIDMCINPMLIESKEIDDAGIQRIISIHQQRCELFDDFERMENPPTDVLKQGAERLKEIEFELQEAWGFERDSDYHNWWFKFPPCKCPKVDNEELMGCDRRIYSGDCPVHV
jgi:hypothetical protein